jgi:Zn-dependent peptidase ImmA (M78 family)
VAKTPVPINPDVLAWAMAQAGVDDAELAAKCGTERVIVREWRTGLARPGKSEFRKLVQRLRRPGAIYFLPEPPVDDPGLTTFRHPPGASAERRLVDREQISIRTAERIQQVSRWTRQKIAAQNSIWPDLGDLEPAAAAAHAREFLDWNVQRQFLAGTHSEVARSLRSSIENRGALVLQLQLSQDGCRGFSLADEIAPVVAVNSAYTVSARIFSMMHEVGHLVRHQQAFCQRLPDTTTERWCERFAAVFLMPQGSFTAYVEDRFDGELVADIEGVASVARRFKVSYRAAALRIEHLNLGVEGLYAEVEARTEFKGSGWSSDNTTPAVRLREWGTSYARLLIDAESQGLLGRADVLEYLNVSDGQLREVRHRLETVDTDIED